jgi:glutathione-regulated potassium-efflux system ancillary protein KefF
LIVVVHAHPYPARSAAGSVLLTAIRDVPELHVRSLYQLYPDFDIDVAAERKALEGAGLVVFLHPVYWYSVPALLKQWFDVVLVKGWAYGEGGTALAGKPCLWAVTTGGDEEAYSAEGRHGRAFEDFAPVVERTARYCGMHWLEPFVLHGAHIVDEAALREAGRRLRDRIEEAAP